MKIEMELSERAEQFLGPNHSEAANRLVEKEAQRLWNIERSKPKERIAGRVGRPRLSPEAKRAREIGDWVGAVYVNKRQELGKDEFERRHGDQCRRLQVAITNDDLDTLLDFERESPWLNR